SSGGSWFARRRRFDRSAGSRRFAIRPALSPSQGLNVMKPRTLYDQIWDDHLGDEQPDGTCLLYIARHIVHEVTSPQAFEGLRAAGRKVHAPDKTLAVSDHNIPTTDLSPPNPDPERIEP